MREVLFGSNRLIARDGRRLRIDGERLSIISGELTRPIRIDSLLFPDEDVDMELSFAVVDGELLLYWRETYRHRHYRQGFLRIVDDSLVEVCRGGGGVEMSH